MQVRRREDADLPPMRRHLLVAAGRLMLVIAGASLLAVALIGGRLVATGGRAQPPFGVVGRGDGGEVLLRSPQLGGKIGLCKREGERMLPQLPCAATSWWRPGG